jgi:hypothetical protein
VRMEHPSFEHARFGEVVFVKWQVHREITYRSGERVATNRAPARWR